MAPAVNDMITVGPDAALIWCHSLEVPAAIVVPAHCRLSMLCTHCSKWSATVVGTVVTACHLGGQPAEVEVILDEVLLNLAEELVSLQAAEP